MTKNQLIDERNRGRKNLIEMIEVYHKLSNRLQKEFDSLIKVQVEELIKLAKRIFEMT